eukprot:1156924-Pelagomonas_calceolata.AAC.12
MLPVRVEVLRAALGGPQLPGDPTQVIMTAALGGPTVFSRLYLGVNSAVQVLSLAVQIPSADTILLSDSRLAVNHFA